eukprot:15484782-Alexandrium_andersonii.AAC.1
MMPCAMAPRTSRSTSHGARHRRTAAGGGHRRARRPSKCGAAEAPETGALTGAGRPREESDQRGVTMADV